MEQMTDGKEKLVKLGSSIRQIRLKKGLKQNELAALCQMEKASISRIETGKTNVTILTLFHIMAVLDTDFPELFV